jgi:hypothetical protein
VQSQLSLAERFLSQINETINMCATDSFLLHCAALQLGLNEAHDGEFLLAARAAILFSERKSMNRA